MRSSELARLVGVSVRTLRHYHQIGLLPEPRRSANGYRVYGAADAIRVLRVRRLAELGLPLSRIVSSRDIERELAILDEEYARQISELIRRREVIEQLRAGGPHADDPVHAQTYLTTLRSRMELPAQAVQVERDAADLLELMFDKGSLENLENLRESEVTQLADVASALATLVQVDQEERTDMVATAIAGVVERLGVTLEDPRVPQTVRDLIQEHVRNQLTPTQLTAIDRAKHRVPRGR